MWWYMHSPFGRDTFHNTCTLSHTHTHIPDEGCVANNSNKLPTKIKDYIFVPTITIPPPTHTRLQSPPTIARRVFACVLFQKKYWPTIPMWEFATNNWAYTYKTNMRVPFVIYFVTDTWHTKRQYLQRNICTLIIHGIQLTNTAAYTPSL